MVATRLERLRQLRECPRSPEKVRACLFIAALALSAFWLAAGPWGPGVGLDSDSSFPSAARSDPGVARADIGRLR
jgi:hypothetical protein